MQNKCHYCGIEFNRVRKRLFCSRKCSSHAGHKISPEAVQILDNPELLKNLLNEGRSCKSIAEQFDINAVTVAKAVKKYGLNGQHGITKKLPSATVEVLHDRHRLETLIKESNQSAVAERLGVTVATIRYHLGYRYGSKSWPAKEIDENTIVPSYKAGATIVELAEQNKTSKYTIKQILIKSGAFEKNKKRIPECLQNPDLLANQKVNKTTLALAYELGVSDSTLARYLDRYGIERSHAAAQSQWENIVADTLAQFTSEPIERRTRRVIAPLELDIWLPTLRVAVECHGHRWHSERSENDQHAKTRHLEKYIACQKQNIKLFQIFDSEFYDPRSWEAWKNVITTSLNVNTKYFARKLDIITINKITADQFHHQHHIQGAANLSCNSINIALENHGEIMSVMSIQRYFGRLELVRYTVRGGVTIVGGGRRILAHLKPMLTDDLWTMQDHRYAVGDTYQYLGFRRSHEVPPSYWYVESKFPHKIHNKRNFRRKTLNKHLPNFNPQMTEQQNMQHNGYRIVWDAGYTAWVL